MEHDFENSLCLGSGISYLCLLFFISLPNAFILIVLYKNRLRFFRKPFSVFVAFICSLDLFTGLVVCSGETTTRFLCAFGDQNISQEGDIVIILGYIGINSSILLVTAMSIDRFVAVIFPHFYRCKIMPKTIAVCNTCIVIFSSIFALLQFSGLSMDLYRTIDIHLHTTFPLSTSTLAYSGIFYFLRKQSRISVKQQNTMPCHSTLRDVRREKRAKIERKFATTSFLILLFLVISLIPYFAVIITEMNCNNCGKTNWFFAFKESTVMFLYLNSIVNPFLATFRINELKTSVSIVLGLRRPNNEISLGRLAAGDRFSGE